MSRAVSEAASAAERVGAGLPPAEAASGVLTIDLGAIVANWRSLRDRVAPAACAAVVKADAYGTGLAETGAALAQAGCDSFFIATPSEGIVLRKVCPAATIYVLCGLARGHGPRYLAARLRPVLGSRDEIAEWRASVEGAGADGAAAIHVDTGMNRLGFAMADFADLMSAAAGKGPGFPLALLMSHFVSSDNPAHPLNARQIEAFAEMRALCPQVKASLANSSGIFLDRAAHHDLARPGYALYGGNPTPERQNPMRGAVTLEVPILQLRDIGAGDTVGYDAQWTAQAPRRIATLAAGYADGYPRGATASDDKRAHGVPAGEAIVAGRHCSFAGRVSMDLITVDVSDIPRDALARGDMATLIGEGLTIDEVGGRAQTIGYEILTRLGRRFARRYRR